MMMMMFINEMIKFGKRWMARSTEDDNVTNGYWQNEQQVTICIWMIERYPLL